MNKLLLIICEGTSDRVTLYSPTKNFIKRKKIAIQAAITHGDIALKENATCHSCIDEIRRIIVTYKNSYHLFSSDFYGVYHVIDTDGCFSIGDIYRQVKRGYYFNEEKGLIFTDSIGYTKIRNSLKRDVYNCLKSIGKIANVKYRVLFFSRNLEHALYNRTNCSEMEKINFSNAFESKYEKDSELFYATMQEAGGLVPQEYENSWTYIMNGTNSIKRGSNFLVLLNELSNYGN